MRKSNKSAARDTEVSSSRQTKKIENLKVILLGDSNVGKTSIFERITKGGYNELVSPSMQATFAAKRVTVTNPYASSEFPKKLEDDEDDDRNTEKKPKNRPSHGLMAAFDMTDEKLTKSDMVPQMDNSIIESHYKAASLRNSIESDKMKSRTSQVRLNIWDTVGTERYMAINRHYF